MTGLQMDRTTRLIGMIDTSGVGLEIGPGYNPLLSKAAGYKIETVDHGTAEEIRQKYKGNPTVDISRIEDVDFIWDGRPLAEVVDKPGHYDYIVASHVIEHTTDFIDFLNNCQLLLKPEGILLLAVPDKRRCFDVLQSLTSTGSILQAHLERRTRHSPGLIFDDVAYSMLRGGAGGWVPASKEPLAFFHNVSKTAHDAMFHFENARSSNHYIDTHAWRFTPSSFRMILKDLSDIGKIELREKEFHGSDIHEFYVSLSRSGAGCPFDRAELAKMILTEMREVSP